MSKLSDFWNYMCEQGLRLPLAFDPVNKMPSITLLFAHITFILASVSTIALHFKPTLFIPTCTSIIFWVIATVLYMLRKISKAKFDLQSKSFDLENDDDSKKP